MHRLFIALILLSLTCGSYAAEVGNLYQAAAPVSSRDAQERSEMAPALLRQVMLKVVGNQNLLDSAPLEQTLSEAEQYVQRYEYQRTNIAAADLTRPDQLQLKLTFDPSAVNRAIQALKLPVWGKVRPDVLVWAVIDNNGQRSLLGLETAGQGVFKPLSMAADKRGLPILMPLMDLEDQNAIGVDAVWQHNEAEVKTASERYGADIVLTASITLDREKAQVDWMAVGDNLSHRWQSQGELQQALLAGMGELADKMALNYSPLADSQGTAQRLKLQISNVLDYADFNRLIAYLEQLDLITDIRVDHLGDQQLDLNIAFRGNLEVLQRTLTVGSLLVEEDNFTGNDAKHYRLLP